MYDPSQGYPTLEALRLEVGVPGTVMDDDTLELVAGSEQEGMPAQYDWEGDLPDRLYQVFVRNVARAVAARGVPLGILAADAEYGTVRLSTRDSEITRLGGMHRKRVFG